MMKWAVMSEFTVRVFKWKSSFHPPSVIRKRHRERGLTVRADGCMKVSHFSLCQLSNCTDSSSLAGWWKLSSIWTAVCDCQATDRARTHAQTHGGLLKYPELSSARTQMHTHVWSYSPYQTLTPTGMHTVCVENNEERDKERWRERKCVCVCAFALRVRVCLRCMQADLSKHDLVKCQDWFWYPPAPEQTHTPVNICQHSLADSSFADFSSIKMHVGLWK